MNKAICTLGIIFLFVGVSVLSSVTSKDISVSDDQILKDNIETADWDENQEIITLIEGNIWFEDYEFDFNGVFKKVELWDCGDLFSYLKITGYKRPLFPLENSRFEASPKHIIANRFFGYIFHGDQFYCSVRGYAIGNIDWK